MVKRYLHSRAEQNTLSDTDAPTTNSGTLMGLLGGLANRVRAITGKSSWTATPDATLADAATHHGRTDNPHSVTRGQIGAAAATALDSHAANQQNPHGVTAAQARARADTWVPGWSDVTGKPVSFPSTWAEVASKPTTYPSTWTQVASKPAVFPPETHTHDYAPSSHVGSGGTAHAGATASVAGFISAADKTKLDGIPAGGGGLNATLYSGDMNALTGTVFRYINRNETTLLNAPPRLTNDHPYCYVRQIEHTSNNLIQTAWDFSNSYIQQRTKLGGTWGLWVRIDVGRAESYTDQKFAQTQIVQPNFLYGFEFTWVDATRVSLSDGSAYVPSTGQVVNISSAQTLSPGSNGLPTTLVANTLYYVYLVDDGRVVCFSGDLYSPTPYSQGAKICGSNNTRRYLGTLLSNTAGTGFVKFIRNGDEVRFPVALADSTHSLRVVSLPLASLPAVGVRNVVSPPVPPYCDGLAAHVSTTSGGAVSFDYNTPNATNQDGYQYIDPNTRRVNEMRLLPDSASRFVYIVNVAGTGGSLYINILGYTERRA